MIVIFLAKGLLYPFAHNNHVNLVKTQIPSGYCVGKPLILEICLATIGVCVFRCVGFGWRTFLIPKILGGGPSL